MAPRRDRRGARTPPAGREARLRRGLRARDAERPLRRYARRVPAHRWGAHARPTLDANPVAAAREARLLPERLPARRCARLERRCGAPLGASESGAGDRAAAAA